MGVSFIRVVLINTVICCSLLQSLHAQSTTNNKIQYKHCSNLLQDYVIRTQQLEGKTQEIKRNLEKEIEEIKQILQDNQMLKELSTTSFNPLLMNKSRYKLFFVRKNWHDADSTCSSLNQTLVHFESVEELNFVVEMIQASDSSACSFGFWTAAIDQGNDAWVWSGTEETVNEDLWASGEPNGDCAHQDRLRPGHLLNDRSCSHVGCFICEV